MPIQINLLAEAQAAEEMRRKDPVKRAVLVGVLLVLLMLFWGSSLQYKIIIRKNGLKDLEGKWSSIEKGYQVAVESKRKAIEVEGRLVALQQLKTNRFLWGTALNAFQQTLSGIDDVQVVRLKTEQAYAQTEEVKGRAGDPKSAKPATATEKIAISIDAFDAGPQPGSQVNKFKEAIANVPYFQSNLQKTNGVLLTSLSAPQSGPLGRTPYVMMTLQCYFPEKVR
jgi:hypothetical protein